MTCAQRHSDRRGFTLVELVVVSALAAGFMFGAATVMASIAKSRNEIRNRQAAGAPPLNWIDLMRWDLVNARGMKLIGTRLVLVGYGAIDPETGQPTGQPAEITYDTRDDRRRRWLIRQQRLISSRTNLGITVQPVLGDVADFKVIIPAKLKERYEKSKLRQKAPLAPKKELGASSQFTSKDQIEPAKANPAIMLENAVIPLDPLVADAGWAEIPGHVILQVKRSGAEDAESITLYPRIDPPR